MLNPYHGRIDIRNILQLQDTQYQSALYLEELVPASSQLDAAVQISSLGEFMLLGITGGYSTLDAEDTDDGINRIYIQLIDGTNNQSLFESFIWSGLFLSPGRFKLAPGAVGAASNQLYLQFPWVYTFPNQGQITVRIRNDAPYVNKVRLMFTGIRIKSQSRQEY
jgi:hypothetical protein